MRNVLLDEMLPIGMAQLLPGHDVQTAVHAGLAGISNGQLIAGAVEKGIDVLVTLDRGIPEQQTWEPPISESSSSPTTIQTRSFSMFKRCARRLRAWRQAKFLS